MDTVRTHDWNVCGRNLRPAAHRGDASEQPEQQPGEPVVFDAEVKPGWDIDGNANGGYLLAIAGRAMAEAAGRPPLTRDRALPPAGARPARARSRSPRCGPVGAWRR